MRFASAWNICSPKQWEQLLQQPSAPRPFAISEQVVIRSARETHPGGRKTTRCGAEQVDGLTDRAHVRRDLRAGQRLRPIRTKGD
eukprot:6196170-Pleurochrysis_carterae.AAC.3